MPRARPGLGTPAARLGWVFAGGGARGAYEVGVCDYIFERIAADLGRPIPLDVISGTSIGALHGAALASWADDPRTGLKLLVRKWSELRLEDVIRIDRRRTFNMFRSLIGRPPRRLSPEAARGGILDPAPLQALLSSSVEFARIGEHLRAGRLHAVSVTATHVRSGQTSIFHQSAATAAPTWAPARTRVSAVKLTAAHALASAAIPFLFPAVEVDGELYCDGSLRQHVPLSPGRHLGADALIVINPRAAESVRASGSGTEGDAVGSPLFLLGKTLNALTLDRIDGDRDRLERINEILEAGRRRFGPGFVDELNRGLVEQGGHPVKPIALLHLQPSEDIGELSAAFVRSRGFRARAGVVSRAIRRLAEAEGRHEADMLSYLLFDGWFARELIALGRHDAEKAHDRIVEFLSNLRSLAT
jgi:NTE family protein